MLKGLDILILVKSRDKNIGGISTPSGHHCEHVVTAAKMGKHILCEKPLDVSKEKVDYMIRTCKEAGVLLGAIFQRRTSMAAISTRNAIRVGQGRSGRDIHGDCLKNMQDKYKVIAVVDPIEHRRKRAENEYGCETYESHHSLMGRADIDIVVNAAPSHLHMPITLELLKGGLNVLCDKPFARKVEEVDCMVEAARESGRILAIFQQSRYAPYFQQVKKIIESGDLGRIIQISIAFNGFARRWDWQCLQSFNGGNLLNTGPHPLDQALQLFGNDVEPEVVCIMNRANTFGAAEDYVKLILKAPRHPVMDLEISSCCAYPCFTYNVHGTKGGLKGSMEHIEWKYFKPEEAPEQKLICIPLMNEDGTPKYCSEQLKWYEKSWDVPEEQKVMFPVIAKAYYEMLYRTLAEGAKLEVTPEQVRRQIAVIEECHRQNPLPSME